MKSFRNINKILKTDIIILFSSGVTIMDSVIIAESLNIIIKLTLEDNFLTASLSFTDNFLIIKLIIIIKELIIIIIKLITANNFLIIFLKIFYKIFNKDC